MRTMIFAFAALLVLSSTAFTQESDRVAQLRAAAEQGDADAQFELGGWYDYGLEGVLQDDAQAVAWYREAADQGLAEAQYTLGNMYRTGRGVPQDFTQAVEWYREAADQGLAEAQFNLGNMYRTGQGVPQDDVEAHRWRSLAASRATGDRQKEYAAARDQLAKRMTPAQLAEAQRLAREWQAAFEKRQTE